MLDVHPPHHPAQSWRDFFVHIATIVVGLIIAVGLEQTVELLHHHQQHRELSRRLMEESNFNLEAAKVDHPNVEAKLAWYTQAIHDITEAIQNGKPGPIEASQPKIVEAEYPSTGVWNAARATGQLAFSPSEEIQAYSTVDEDVLAYMKAEADYHAASVLAEGVRAGFCSEPCLRPDSSKSSINDLRTYLGYLTAGKSALRRELQTDEELYNDESSILSGKPDLLYAKAQTTPSSRNETQK